MVEELIKKFNEIRDRGYLESIANYAFSERSDGAAGESLQYYMGIDSRDNRQEADWNGWEIKTKRNSSNTATTLFSKKPTFPLNGDRYMLEKWGIPDEIFPNKLKLNTTLFTTRFSKVHLRTTNVPTLKMKIINDRDNEKVSLLVCDNDENKINDSVYWSYTDINNGFKKLKNTILIEPLVKKINNKDHFYYKSATILLESNLDSFLNCLDNGIIRYDHRWSVDHRGKHIGQEHNHGGGFRFNHGGDWMKLASKVYDI